MKSNIIDDSIEINWDNNQLLVLNGDESVVLLYCASNPNKGVKFSGTIVSTGDPHYEIGTFSDDWSKLLWSKLPDNLSIVLKN